MSIRVELVGTHHRLREGLRRILEGGPDVLVVAEADSQADAVDLARRHHPDVAVVDLGAHELNAIAVTAEIHRHSPSTAVLVLSMHADEQYVTRAVEAGAQGYMLKDSVEDELLPAVESLRHGRTFFSPALERTRRV